MSINDPIGDMLTRVRNGHMARLSFVDCPHSNMRVSVIEVLKSEGYVRDYEIQDLGSNKKSVRILLKYTKTGQAVIDHIARVSKPGRRVYVSVADLSKDKFRNGLGTRIVSTSKGVMTDKEAIAQNLAGEHICNVF